MAVWRRGTSGNGIGVGGEEDERKTGEGSGSSKEGQEEGRKTRVEGMYVSHRRRSAEYGYDGERAQRRGRDAGKERTRVPIA